MEFSDPYRGSPIVPHASEKFFTQYFIGVMVSRLIRSIAQRQRRKGGVGTLYWTHTYLMAHLRDK